MFIMNSGKKIFFNAALRWSGEILIKLLWFMFFIILARQLGANEFGYFNYAFSFASMLTVFTDLGTNLLIVKTISKNESVTHYYLTNVIFLKIILSLAVFIVIIAYANVAAEPPLVLVLISLSLLISAFLDPLNSVFRAYGKMYYETSVMLLWRILIVGISLFGLYWLNFRLLGISISFIVAGVIALMVSFQIIKYSFKRENISFKMINTGCWGQILKESLPVGTLVVVITIFYKLNVVVLEYFSNSDEVGWYSASFKLIEASFFISSIFIASIFPYFCRDGIRNRISDYALLLFKKSFLFLFGAALILALVLFLFSNEIISRLYGSGYIPAIKVLNIVAWMPIFIYLNELFLFLFLSIDKQMTIIKLMIIPICVYFLSCFTLIPKWNCIGAAWSLLLTQVILFITNILYLRYIRSVHT